MTKTSVLRKDDADHVCGRKMHAMEYAEKRTYYHAYANTRTEGTKMEIRTEYGRWKSDKRERNRSQ